MTTTYGKSHYCVSNGSPLRCAPRDQIGSRANANEIPPQPHSDVHLLPCKRPSGSLEPAPRTSLRAGPDAGQWEGFWGEDGRYYARCARLEGTEEWYRITDSLKDPKVLAFVSRRTTHNAARTLPRDVSRTLRYSRTERGSILVGTFQRREGSR
jgi:hypothetical protein